MGQIWFEVLLSGDCFSEYGECIFESAYTYCKSSVLYHVILFLIIFNSPPEQFYHDRFSCSAHYASSYSQYQHICCQRSFFLKKRLSAVTNSLLVQSASVNAS